MLINLCAETIKPVSEGDNISAVEGKASSAYPVYPVSRTTGEGGAEIFQGVGGGGGVVEAGGQARGGNSICAAVAQHIINSGICIYDEVTMVLSFSDTAIVVPQKKKPQITRGSPTPRRFRSCLDESAPTRRESAGRFALVCTHAHEPTARFGAETAQGGAPANPHTNRK